MQPHQTPRFNEWLAAEKEASAAERVLHREMLESARGGPAPQPDFVLAARAKRAKAHWLFDEAMQELKALAESLHHRRIQTRRAASSAETDQQH